MEPLYSWVTNDTRYLSDSPIISMVLDSYNYNVPLSVKTNSLYWGQFHCSWLKCIFMLNINVGIFWLPLAVNNYRDIYIGLV